ncbi:hypothetical protein [Pantoea phage Nufs112]|nr:hypothetical protein [Pantoea phage Nufs112]
MQDCGAKLYSFHTNGKQRCKVPEVSRKLTEA